MQKESETKAGYEEIWGFSGRVEGSLCVCGEDGIVSETWEFLSTAETKAPRFPPPVPCGDP